MSETATTKTMTLWGAYVKLEAIAAAAERINLPGRTEIRERVEKILMHQLLDKARLTELVTDWRGQLGAYAPRVAQYLDSALFDLLDYLDAEEIMLSGSELLDQLIADGAETYIASETQAAERRYRLAHLY